MKASRRADFDAMLRLCKKIRTSGGDQIIVHDHNGLVGMFYWDNRIPDTVEHVMVNAPVLIEELLQEINNLEDEIMHLTELLNYES